MKMMSKEHTPRPDAICQRTDCRKAYKDHFVRGHSRETLQEDAFCFRSGDDQFTPISEPTPSSVYPDNEEMRTKLINMTKEKWEREKTPIAKIRAWVQERVTQEIAVLIVEKIDEFTAVSEPTPSAEQPRPRTKFWGQSGAGVPTSPISSEEPTPSAHTNAYSAGFFVGEGTIYVTRVVTKWGRVRHSLGCSIVNTELDLLESFKRNYGGAVRSRKGTKLSRKPIWEWRIYGFALVAFLEKVLPYLQGRKLLRANYALELQSRLLQRKAPNGSVAPLSIEEINERDVITNKMRLV